MTYEELTALIEEQGEQDFLQSIAFQKYALYIKEMEGNEEAYERLLAQLQSKVGDNSITIENEDAVIDIAVPYGIDAVNESLKLIEEDQELVDSLKAKINAQNIDLLLKAAGYSDQEIEDINEHPPVLFDIKTQKLFHDEIGAAHLDDAEKRNTFVSALASTKDGILKTLGNPSVKVALGAIGVAAAVATSGGAFAIGLAGTRLATSLFEHEKVTDSFARHGNKILGKAQDMGLISEKSAGLIKSGFSKLRDAITSKTAKRLAMVAGIGGLAYAGMTMFDANAPVTAADASLDASSAAPLPELAEYTVNAGDNAWKIAENHYLSVLGEKPTPQQIVAMVNDMELSNPGIIKPDDIIKLPNDLSQYATDAIGKVDAEWLNVPEALETGVELGSPLAEGVNISEAYDITSIANSNFDGASLSEIAEQNPGLDLHALEAGDEIEFNGQVYEVPSAEALVIEKLFPNGANPLIDTDELADQILKANGIETKTMLFFDNGDLGKQLLEKGTLAVPEVDTSILQPQMSEVTVSGMIHGGSGNHQLKMDILRTCFPDGIPELLDRSAFMEAIREANPELNTHLSKDDYYNFKLEIPDMTTPQSDYSPAAKQVEQIAANRADNSPSMGM